jgi:isoaspartyl peptidase/L-asparaginase-like protein (Ntn-hydrolase superfamily)
MAGKFVSASTQYLMGPTLNAVHATATVITIAAWIKPVATTSAATRCITSIANGSVTNIHHSLNLFTDGTVQCVSQGTTGRVASVSAITGGEWHFVLGRVSSSAAPSALC